ISRADQSPMILRPKAITKERIKKDLDIEAVYDRHLLKESETPKAPGMKYKHYSPNTKVLMVKQNDWAAALTWIKENNIRAGILAGPTTCDRMRFDTAAVYSCSDDSVEAATKGLFAGLRALDASQLQLDVILAATFAEQNLGLAYMNRLKKAAAQNYFKLNNFLCYHRANKKGGAGEWIKRKNTVNWGKPMQEKKSDNQ